MPTSSPFDKRTLRQRCTNFVRDQIVSGAMAPGQHLIETQLADELGVSRGTLREALRPLEIEGLIVSDGRGHMLVREMSAQEIRDVFQVRAALEILAATILAQRSDRQAVAAELTAALAPLQDPDIEFARQIEVDLGFHELLCKLTGNPTLLESWRQLIGKIEMMIIAAGPLRASDRMRYAEHIGIVNSIASGDQALVSKTLQAHMDDFAMKYLFDKGPELQPSR
ncbi:GntR family transcriptional regulator [Microbacterium sp. GXF0217]